jgi:hypothetical protein
MTTGTTDISESRAGTRRIQWPHVITVLSTAVLIAVQVFVVAYAGGGAVAHAFGVDELGRIMIQIPFVGVGLVFVAAFIRQGSRIEPFTAPD